MEKFFYDFSYVLAVQELAISEYLEKYVAQTENISSSVDVGISSGEFRCHVKRGSVMATSGSQFAILVFVHYRLFQVWFTPNFCQSPVDDVGGSEFPCQDICRFEIPVNDASGMSMGQRLTNLNLDID